jgi:2-C-methyl-D-erythritol 2,4-cyclodiphosphate synthase
MRVGIGVDAHRFKIGRPLILGGVHIPFPKGLLGHSDADVLTHTLVDACIGAMGLGSIGVLFPNTSQFKDAKSTWLLEKTMQLVNEKGYEIVNTDSVIVAQEPAIMPYVKEMKKILSPILNCDAVSIKATTFEGLGFEGKKQGISCQSVVLLQAISSLH